VVLVLLLLVLPVLLVVLLAYGASQPLVARCG